MKSSEWHRLTKVDRETKTAICSQCGPDTPIRVYDGCSPACKTSRRISDKGEGIISKRRATYAERREIVRKIKEVPCMDCELEWPHYVMQFDHRPGTVKLFDIGHSVDKVGWQRLLDEIAKCDIVCCNCHSIRTWLRNHPE